VGDRVTQITAIRQAWETQVKSAIPGVNVSGWYFAGVPTPRIMLIEDSDAVDILSDFGSQYAVLRYRVVVEESGADGLSALQRLDAYVSWDDPRSVYAALNVDRSLGLGESTIKTMNVADMWNVDALTLRAELPIWFAVIKEE
jgi:hypothetical protein